MIAKEKKEADKEHDGHKKQEKDVELGAAVVQLPLGRKAKGVNTSLDHSKAGHFSGQIMAGLAQLGSRHRAEQPERAAGV